MRGDRVYRIYGVHAGRADDVYFGAFRTAAEAEVEIVKLGAREMHGANWAAKYHDQGFVIREAAVETDFEFPALPKPRDRFVVQATLKPNNPGQWSSTTVEVLRRTGAGLEPVCGYERNHGMYGTFEPFRQGNRELALISRDYTRTAVLDLTSGTVLAEEPEDSNGFCPVGFYVPDWWDVNDASIIPGSEYWDADLEWPTGDFGFVWGCVWGDDRSWKVQHLDLRRVQEGVLVRDDRFGYVELASIGWSSPCFEATLPSAPTGHPPFIHLSRRRGTRKVTFAVEVDFDLTTGKPRSPD